VIISGLVGTLTYKRLKGMSLNMNSQRFRLMSRSSPGLMKLVHRIAGDPFTTFIVLTSRSQSMCERVLGESDAWLAAENGYFLKRGQEQPWQVHTLLPPFLCPPLSFWTAGLIWFELDGAGRTGIGMALVRCDA